MLDSGFQNKAVRTLATAGSSSDYAVVERNLHSRFASEYAVEPFYISLTLHDRETWRPQVQLVATVAPYEIFSALYAAPGAPFRTTMMPTGEDAVGRYWDDALRSSWGRNHACNCDPNLSIHRCRVIPVAYHSDGVEVYDGTEFHVFSWSSLLANKGDILDHKLLVCCIEENLLVKDKTFAELIFFFHWNNVVLESGEHPSADHLGKAFEPGSRRARLAGKPIAGDSVDQSWRCSFSAIFADLKEKVKINKFVRNYAANFCCEFCLASKSLLTTNAFDFRPEAGHRQHLTSHRHYLLTTSPGDLSPWSIFRNWDITRNKFDMLHVLWLGYAKDIAASALLFLSRSYYPLTDLDNALQLLWIDMKVFYRTQRQRCCICKFSHNTICFDGKNSYPTLTSRIKGANTKLICKYIAWKARRYATYILVCCSRMCCSVCLHCVALCACICIVLYVVRGIF